MYYTGNTFKSTVESPIMKLDFSNIILYGTGGTVQLGVSGNNNKLQFLFSGQKIISPTGKLVGTFNSGEAFDISLSIDTGLYEFSINDSIIVNKRNKPNFNIQRFFINSTGLPVSLQTKIYSENIPYSLTFPNNFQALNNLTGVLTNNSPYNFKVFNNSFEFIGTDVNQVTGNPTGFVNSASNLNLVYQDNNDSLLDSIIDFDIVLNTSIGDIISEFSVNRLSGLETTTGNLQTNINDISLSSLFDGSGIIPNQYIYINSPSSLLISYYCPLINLKGEEKQKTINFSLTDISPLDNSVYNSSYVTGFLLTNSGEYMVPPTAKFSGYYYISGLDTNLSSILLSSGCSGNIPITFSGNNSNGIGASGFISSVRVTLSGIYGEGINSYYLPQNFTLYSGGTGYISQPRAFLQTGVNTNCYDVGGKYNANYLIFKPFTGNGLLGSIADYLTGEVLTTTGLVSGGQLTGYLVTGIRFTNIGSGFNTGNFIPKVSFYRDSSDFLLGANKDASGTLQMKSTGLYNFSNNWVIQTGISSNNLTGMNGFNNSTILDSGTNYITIQIFITGADWTQPIIAKLTTSMGNSTVSHLITGLRVYDTSTGFLKKKNNLDLIMFNTNQDLSFDLTGDELSDFYTTPDFLNNSQTISIGDLSFED